MNVEAFEIREERACDMDAVAVVHGAAFGRSNEARLVDHLRCDGVIAASIVGLVAGQVVGNVVFSRLPLRGGAQTVTGVALAPVGVLPRHQRRGIGSAMIRRGLELCTARGYVAALVLGDPSYYARFGFLHDTANTVRSPYSGAGSAWMALELRAESLKVPTEAQYPPAFAIVD